MADILDLPDYRKAAPATKQISAPSADSSILVVRTLPQLRCALSGLMNEPGEVEIRWERNTGVTRFRFPAIVGATTVVSASGKRVQLEDYQRVLDRNRRVHTYLRNLAVLPKDAAK